MVGFDRNNIGETLGSIRGIPLELQCLFFNSLGSKICVLPNTDSWHSPRVQCPLGIVLSPFEVDV